MEFIFQLINLISSKFIFIQFIFLYLYLSLDEMAHIIQVKAALNV